ncbi:MAG: hypothetical protein MR051_09630 [Lentisphaeria bacterium]|nr:hypothetical protein [Lentisphaeria bacterium]
MLKKTFWVIVLIGAVTVAAVAGIWYFRSGRKISPPHTAHASAAAAPSLDSVRMVIEKYRDEKLKSELSRVEFRVGDRVLFSKDCFYHVGFMRESQLRGNAYEYYAMKPDDDWRDFLTDIRGDGDKRYLILADWGGGNSAYCYDGYLIDAKAGFAYLGEVPAGEMVGYKLPNPELIFFHSDDVEYFGVHGYATIGVNLKLVPGKEPEFAGKRMKAFHVSEFRRDLANPDQTDKLMGEKEYRWMMFLCLYCDLATGGWMKHARAIAKKGGFTQAEIDEYDPKARKSIRTSRYYKYLVRLNGFNF